MIELKSRSRSARYLTATVLRGVVLAGLTFAAACGKGDGPIGPGTDDDGPDVVAPKSDLSGTWSFNVSFGNAQIDLSCDSRSQMTLQHSGSSISGEYGGGTITCTIQGQTFSDNVSGSFNGTVSGTKVSFQDDEGAQFTGTISDSDRMQGTVSGVLDLENGQQLDLSGNWSATR
ncbi:MAG TPA: hypothetical protein VH763_05010 [Gemmatimonadales bacterium]|jgi:hypothetical protein